MHFVRQAVDVIKREKKNSNAPVMIAPITLVATKVIAKRITDVKTVPKIPVRIAGRLTHTHSLLPKVRKMVHVTNRTPRYTTAIPNNTHKNAGVTVMTAVILSIAVTIPMIMLAMSANPIQLNLQLQLNILFTSDFNI